jgi:flagellin-like hook-associated protein FlgL
MYHALEMEALKMADITLSASVRGNLLSLQNTASLIGRTQDRLSTGLAISSPLDDAVKYFQAKSLSSRATDLTERKDKIDQGISALETVIEATDAIEDLVQNIKGIVDSARSGSKEERKEYNNQIKELVAQVQRLVDDASYQGLNLLNSSTSTLSVRFSEKADSKLEIKGVNFNTEKFFLNSQGAAAGVSTVNISNIIDKLGFAAAGSSGLAGYNLSVAVDLACFNKYADLAILRLDKTVSNLRAKSATIAQNAAILNIRLDFTAQYTNVLQEGADKLTLADLNEEGANLLALQTRQQLGIQALSFAGQAEQSIIGLFR